MNNQVKYGMIIKFDFDRQSRTVTLELSDPTCKREQVQIQGPHKIRALMTSFGAKSEHELHEKIVGRSIKYSQDCMGTMEAFVRVPNVPVWR